MVPAERARQLIREGQVSVYPRPLRKTSRDNSFSRIIEAAKLTTYQPPVRSSAFSTLRACPRKFMFVERLGLRLLGDYQPALKIGIAYHEFIAAYYSGHSTAQVANLVPVHLANLEAELNRAVDPHTGMLPNGGTVEDYMSTAYKDSMLAHAMAANFIKLYPPESLLEHYELVGIEMPYIVAIKGIIQPLAIRADMLVRDRKTGDYWVVDHKTCSGSPRTRSAVLTYSFQARLYAFVLSLALSNEARRAQPGLSVSPAPIGGWIHNIIQKPTIRLKKNQTFEAYIQECYDWYLLKTEERPDDPPIIQSAVPYSVAPPNAEFIHQIKEVDQAARAHFRPDFFYRDTSECISCFGNKLCPFFPLCACENERRVKWPHLLTTRYTQDPRPIEGLLPSDDSLD
jgi:hypothetical protein